MTEQGYKPRRGDIVTCEGMSEPHEVHLECGHPVVLVERPTDPLAPFARRVAAAKRDGTRFVAVT